MSKSFDPQIINPILTGFIDELIVTKGGLVPSQPFESAAKPIEEYEGRMRVSAIGKFDGAVYIAATSFYLNSTDMLAHKARGALVCYVETEIADKILKAAGLEVPYDEDDESMEGLCGSLCHSMANTIKDRLSADGFLALEISTPAVFKNTISEGVEFGKDQDEKQVLSFYFRKHKALVLEWTMAPIPKK